MSRTARAGLLLLPLGPLCVALLRYLLPYRTTDGGLAMARAVAAHPTRESIALWLGLIAVLTLIPGLVSVFAALPASRLKYAAIGLCVPGYLCLGALLGEDQILWAAAHNHTPPRTTSALLDALHPSVGIATAIFVVGHIGRARCCSVSRCCAPGGSRPGPPGRSPCPSRCTSWPGSCWAATRSTCSPGVSPRWGWPAWRRCC